MIGVHFKLFLIFSTSADMAEILLKEGWKPNFGKEQNNTFKFAYISHKTGQRDEGLLRLNYRLPQGISSDDLEVDWESSSY